MLFYFEEKCKLPNAAENVVKDGRFSDRVWNIEAPLTKNNWMVEWKETASWSFPFWPFSVPKQVICKPFPFEPFQRNSIF